MIETITKLYNLNSNKLILIDEHFGTKIYLMVCENKKYIVKSLPNIYSKGMEEEGYLTDFLLKNGIAVPRLLKNINDNYCFEKDENKYHIQEFIDGDTFHVNTAPDWILDKSANSLGKIHNALSKHKPLEINFGKEFFSSNNVHLAINHYSKQLENTLTQPIITELQNRICHLNRILNFEIGTDNITYVNSHGDYHIGQIIAKNNDISIIDWTSACLLPAALEVICSYTTIDVNCKNGVINADGLKRYIEIYSKYSNLNNYDLKIMPYIYYFQQILCHYSPPYGNEPNLFYKNFCKLINNFTDWLYKNVEKLSNSLEKF